MDTTEYLVYLMIYERGNIMFPSADEILDDVDGILCLDDTDEYILSLLYEYVERKKVELRRFNDNTKP